MQFCTTYLPTVLCFFIGSLETPAFVLKRENQLDRSAASEGFNHFEILSADKTSHLRGNSICI